MPSANLKEVSTVNGFNCDTEFDNIIKSLPPSKLCMVDFHATWCGPCHAIRPTYEKLANEYPHCQFLKVDVDRLQEIARRYQVSAMPTFIGIKGTKKIAEMKGANPSGLTNMVKTHAGPAGGTGYTLGGSSGSAAEEHPESLIPHLFTPHITCLNESSAHPLTSIVGANRGPRGSSYLESESDAELLICLPFNQPVRIKSLSISSPVCPSQAPKTISLFINPPTSLDFDSASTLTPTQELVLTPEQSKGGRVDVRFVKFQSVQSLWVLVKDNQGDEETTRIDSLDVFGTGEDGFPITTEPALPHVGGLWENRGLLLIVLMVVVGIVVHSTSGGKLQSMEHEH